MARDYRADATVREMNRKNRERKRTSKKQREHREKQIRRIAVLLSLAIVLTVSGVGGYAGLFPESSGIFSADGAGNGSDSNSVAAVSRDIEGEPGEAAEGTGENSQGSAGAENSTTSANVNSRPHDRDGDGIPDQQDIFESAKAYVATKPQYESRYYMGGYPDDGYGVCTDVVGFAFLGAGFDLQQLMKEDIEAHLEDYEDIETPDPKIDFRRVPNIKIYLDHTARICTTDLSKTEEWQPGDIVTWPHHIGIVSDKRNENGVPYVIHHAGVTQTEYEEDILEGKSRYTYVREITGHYRVK